MSWWTKIRESVVKPLAQTFLSSNPMTAPLAAAIRPSGGQKAQVDPTKMGVTSASRGFVDSPFMKDMNNAIEGGFSGLPGWIFDTVVRDKAEADYRAQYPSNMNVPGQRTYFTNKPARGTGEAMHPRAAGQKNASRSPQQGNGEAGVATTRQAGGRL